MVHPSNKKAVMDLIIKSNKQKWNQK
jgi:hypothetical protein